MLLLPDRMPSTSGTMSNVLIEERTVAQPQKQEQQPLSPPPAQQSIIHDYVGLPVEGSNFRIFPHFKELFEVS